MYIGSNTPLRQLQEYYNRIRIGGGTTPTDGANLLAFVEGINDLGLWANMVCWPLRSIHNAGTGSVAYSLGGWPLVTSSVAANMTLFASPTWGNTGIATNNSTQYLSTAGGSSGPLAATSSITIVFCGADQAPSKATRGFCQFSGGGLIGTGLSYENRVSGTLVGVTSDPGNANATSTWGNTATPTHGSHFVTMISSQNGAQGYSMNGAGYTTTATTFPGSAGSVSPIDKMGAAIARIQGAQTAALLTSGLMGFTTLLSSSQMATLYNLYKSTIGQGLGLP